MKIVHIMASRALGGAETYSTDVMLALHKAGVQQTVVMSRHAPRFAELQAAGLVMAPDILDIPLSWVQKYRLKRLVEREKPDVIHCWMRRAASLVPATSRPVIGWFGGYYEPDNFKTCTHFVGVTKDIVAHMIKRNVRGDRAHFIPTFPDIVDMPPVARADFSTPADAKVFLTLSRLHPKKGLDTLLRALVGLPNVYLWMAGEGPDRQKLEQLTAALGLEHRVRFLGWRTDRSALLRAADVCVLPSRYEPFGTVILEAWAAKVPLVACRSAGPALHVTDGENGLLVDIDDVASLTRALALVIDDAGLRVRLTDAGFAAYRATYTREAVLQHWLDYYQNLVSDPNEQSTSVVG